MSGMVLQARDIWKSYQGPLGPVDVLRGVDLGVARGEVVALLGASGVGKSTLLNVLGSLDAPDRGEALLEGTSLFAVNAAGRARMRNEGIGFVFQFHHLLPEFTAIENVAMKLRLRGVPDASAAEASRALLERFGLAARLHHAPDALSGGEQQRVAVARALVGDPRVLLADEPTGNLDPRTASALFEELHTVARERGIAILWATHNETLARRSDRILRLQEGKLVEASLD
ncbi:MAG: ABC transporter ATP-binding protein [Vicinamibacteria bacterium]|nr:ABC transporter ATP-binding protein [Vicinamibacteria bacterium]